MGPFQLLLIIIFCLVLNLPFYDLQNRNIASTTNNNTTFAFWLGALGGLGLIICLIKYVKPTWKKILFGVGRFFLWAIVIQIIIELGIISQSFSGILFYFIGFPFIFRGKNIYKFSYKNSKTTINS